MDDQASARGHLGQDGALGAGPGTLGRAEGLSCSGSRRTQPCERGVHHAPLNLLGILLPGGFYSRDRPASLIRLVLPAPAPARLRPPPLPGPAPLETPALLTSVLLRGWRGRWGTRKETRQRRRWRQWPEARVLFQERETEEVLGGDPHIPRSQERGETRAVLRPTGNGQQWFLKHESSHRRPVPVQ